MDTRLLRHFVGVAESGSISRAAELLHVAQPGLSLSIQKLEESLGVSLFHRSRKGVALTNEGERLLSHARLILRQVQAASDDLRSGAAEPIGPLILGMPQSLAATLVVPLVAEIMRRWPRIGLRIIDANTGYIPEWLRTGHLHLGFVFRAEAGRGVDYRNILQEELILVGPAVTGEERPEITSAELARLPLILPSRRHSLRELIEAYARQHDIRLNVVAEIDAMPQLRDLAMAGIGWSILSYASVRREVGENRLRGMRIDPPLLRPCYLCRSTTAPTTRPMQAVEGLIIDLVDGMLRRGEWPAALRPMTGHLHANPEHV